MGYAIDYFNASDRLRPDVWAAQREAEGWDALGVGDHIRLDGRWAFHSFACLGAMAVTTERVSLATMFADSVVRSPIEFAQFALTMQTLSNGRFEAGIGAGWFDGDAELAGVRNLTASIRARRYRESVTIIREAFAGSSTFEGEFYSVLLPDWGPIADPPPLFAAVGGAWGATHIAPLVDRIEVSPGMIALRGVPDFARLRSITREDVLSLVEMARSANPQAVVGVGMFVGVGDDPSIDGIRSVLGDCFLGQFYGPAAQVADALRALHEETAVDRVSVLAVFEGNAEAIASELFAP